MSKAILSESPMVQVGFESVSFTPEILEIKELPFQGHINLRGKLSNESFKSAAEGVLNLSLPETPNTFVSAEAISILWLGPDEWLIVCSEDERERIFNALFAALEGIFSSVVDQSSAQTILDLSGEAARTLLSTDCPLDLHPSLFTAGSCAQTRLAKTAVTLYKLDDGDGFRLIVRRSFSDYLGIWLLQVAKDWGFINN